MKTKPTAAQAAARDISKPALPAVDSVKQVVRQIIHEFISEEAGNKVTRNNMAGLSMQIFAAIEGNITITQQEGSTP